MPKAVVGLGNPGIRYAETRHNAGFMLVDLFAARHGATLSARRHEAAWVEVEVAGERAILIEPLAFMNRSGPPVAAFAAELGIAPDAILVAHDEIDLPPARIRMKRGGGTAGHRGLESLVEALGTRDFPRLRIGIGRPPAGVPVPDFVLGRFSEDERHGLERTLVDALAGIEAWLRDGIDAAIALVHAPPFDERRARPAGPSSDEGSGGA